MFSPPKTCPQENRLLRVFEEDREKVSIEGFVVVRYPFQRVKWA
jgi:hypothetical protein